MDRGVSERNIQSTSCEVDTSENVKTLVLYSLQLKRKVFGIASFFQVRLRPYKYYYATRLSIRSG